MVGRGATLAELVVADARADQWGHEWTHIRSLVIHGSTSLMDLVRLPLTVQGRGSVWWSVSQGVRMSSVTIPQIPQDVITSRCLRSTIVLDRDNGPRIHAPLLRGLPTLLTGKFYHGDLDGLLASCACACPCCSPFSVV